MSSMRLYIRPKYREGIRFQRKLGLFASVIAAGFAVLVLRLSYLQLMAGGEFKQLSDQNRIRLLPLKAPRGLVYDRSGRLLIDNRPSFTVSIIPAESSDPSVILSRLGGFLDFDQNTVIKQIQASRLAPFRQIVVARDVSIEETAPIEEYSLQLPGIIITAEPNRRFPLGSAAAQVLGYPGQISAAELARLSDEGYLMGDSIGKAGIELVAEQWLRGSDGGMQVQVYANARPQLELDAAGNPRVRIDTAGHELLTLGKKPPLSGNTVILNIDAEMQKIAAEEMGEYNGAIVILDAESGAVRAMVVRPSYDPNVFVSAGADSERIAILRNPGHPMLNRAIQAYPPGSTFKIVMAYAALAEEAITPETRFTCTGSFKLGRRFRCWKDAGHGSLNLVEALAYSCDVFFYNVGLELGIDRIASYCELFGFGRPTGIDLYGEMSGLVPSRQWKRENFRAKSDKRWYDGETLNTAIGQGYLLVTPLQMARAYAAIANGGKLMRPYLIRGVSTPGDEQSLMRNVPSQEGALENVEALELIVEGLRGAINSRKPFYGTGWRAKNKTVALMGKTGTAQVVAFKERAETKEQLAEIPYKHRDHAWFVVVTEDTKEKLVILALFEHAGHASESTVPAVREIAIRVARVVGMIERTPDEPESKEPGQKGASG